MRRSKRLLAKVHLWLGLTIGLLWAMQGLTGATLVFHRELDRWAHPEWRGGDAPPLPLERLISIARQQTGRTVTAIGILDRGRDLRTATYSDAVGTQRMLILDAATGAPVGERLPQPQRPESGSSSRFVYMIHQKLASGETGETIIGLSGSLLLSSAMVGMWIAWPRRGNWRALISPRGWRTVPQKLYSWHRIAGLVFGIVFVLVATGGIYMTFSESIRHGLGSMIALDSPYKAPAKPASAGPEISAQAALERGETLFPQSEFVRLDLSAPDKPFFVVRLRQRGETRAWAGATTVTIDARTGNIVQVHDGLHGPFVDRVLDAQFSIHNGEAGGLLGRLLIMAAGLSLPTFYISGVWLWFRKRRRIWLAGRRLAPA